MLALHCLAVLGALVFGYLGWVEYQAGFGSLWKALLLPLLGLVLPYTFAVLWVLAVAPPDFKEIWRLRRSRVTEKKNAQR